MCGFPTLKHCYQILSRRTPTGKVFSLFIIGYERTIERTLRRTTTAAITTKKKTQPKTIWKSIECFKFKEICHTQHSSKLHTIEMIFIGKVHAASSIVVERFICARITSFSRCAFAPKRSFCLKKHTNHLFFLSFYLVSSWLFFFFVSLSSFLQFENKFFVFIFAQNEISEQRE